MGTGVSLSVEVSEDRARRLQKLAEEQGTTEAAIVERALDLLFDLGSEGDREVWQGLAEPSLRLVWDNEADAVYDDWKGLYGIPER